MRNSRILLPVLLAACLGTSTDVSMASPASPRSSVQAQVAKKHHARHHRLPILSPAQIGVVMARMVAGDRHVFPWNSPVQVYFTRRFGNAHPEEIENPCPNAPLGAISLYQYGRTQIKLFACPLPNDASRTRIPLPPYPIQRQRVVLNQFKHHYLAAMNYGCRAIRRAVNNVRRLRVPCGRHVSVINSINRDSQDRIIYDSPVRRIIAQYRCHRSRSKRRRFQVVWTSDHRAVVHTCAFLKYPPFVGKPQAPSAPAAPPSTKPKPKPAPTPVPPAPFSLTARVDTGPTGSFVPLPLGLRATVSCAGRYNEALNASAILTGWKNPFLSCPAGSTVTWNVVQTNTVKYFVESSTPAATFTMPMNGEHASIVLLPFP
jgi:hypothetical protein